MTAPTSSSFEKVITAVLFVPFELGAKFVDDFPTRLTRAKQQIDIARRLGKNDVDHRVAAATATVHDPTGGSVDADGHAAIIGEARIEDRPEPTPQPSVSLVDELALVDYDHLPASHIISKLDGLTIGEVDAIGRYEVANRARRTVLGKIDQLRAESA